MKHPRRTPLAALGLAALACATLGLAAPWGTAGSPTPQDQEHEEGGPLHDAMEHMKGSMRRLGRMLEGDDPVVALPLIVDFQRNVVVAKAEQPHLAEKLSGAEKEQFLTDYQATMVRLLRMTCDVELALLEGRMDDARQGFEALREMQKPAHERFRGDEDEEDH